MKDNIRDNIKDNMTPLGPYPDADANEDKVTETSTEQMDQVMQQRLDGPKYYLPDHLDEFNKKQLLKVNIVIAFCDNEMYIVKHTTKTERKNILQSGSLYLPSKPDIIIGYYSVDKTAGSISVID